MSEKTRPPVSVTVAPEWGSYPLWIEYSPDEPRDNAPAESLSDYGAEPSLISSINSWDDSYQAVYDPNDPASSGFESESRTNSWIAEGVALTRRLSAQLPPGVSVRFRKVGQEFRFTAPSEKEEITD